ncbi:hypothetical protein FOTG_18997 [Fusarium oxysporum f. sp. vasinfectum 25433]|uniref:Uncharacterized protein n=1 Tax=Fusarium oxysporum f. sp. vasinfectum 25433 TaxID=1089449 RepID=X0KUM6_FUSOX|nr:hypothetical protein FOTG_18997 [Fusarium oxysporum f. sp. vasinfectum 25433]
MSGATIIQEARLPEMEEREVKDLLQKGASGRLWWTG